MEAAAAAGDVVPKDVVPTMGAIEYPPPLTTHLSVVEDRNMFYGTLKEFHCEMGTPLTRMPHIAGKELDLHLLYAQVTQRGGIERVRNPRYTKTITRARARVLSSERTNLPPSCAVRARGHLSYLHFHCFRTHPVRWTRMNERASERLT